MHITLQREALLKPLRLVAGAVEKRQVQVPILANVLLNIEKNKFSLVTTDQEIELISHGLLGGETDNLQITVPFRKLMDITKALPESSQLDISLDDTRAVIRSGRSRFTLSTLQAEQFPNVKDARFKLHCQLEQKILKKALEKCAFAMAEQDVRYYLNGMLFEVKANTLSLVAADGHRLALANVPLNEAIEPTRVIVPRKGVLEIMRLLNDTDAMLDLWLGSHYIRVATPEVTLTSRLLEGKFPPYEQLIPRNNDKMVIAERDGLRETFSRASVLFTDKSRAVRLKLQTNAMQVIAINSEQDEVEDFLEVTYDGPEMEIGFNVKYLLDFLAILDTSQVKLSFRDAASSALVESAGAEQGLYVIMPMRI